MKSSLKKTDFNYTKAYLFDGVRLRVWMQIGVHWLNIPGIISFLSIADKERNDKNIKK